MKKASFFFFFFLQNVIEHRYKICYFFKFWKSVKEDLVGGGGLLVCNVAV